MTTDAPDVDTRDAGGAATARARPALAEDPPHVDGAREGSAR